MTQMADRVATGLRPAPMIAGAIPLIDVAGHLGGDRRGQPQARSATALGLRECRLLLPLRPRRPAVADRPGLRGGGPVSRPTDGDEARAEINEHNIGYLPISDAASPQAAAQGRKPSQNEAYFLRRECTPDDPAVIANRRFHGLNQWPGDLPGFRETTLEYMRTLEALCRRLVPLYALALDLPAVS